MATTAAIRIHHKGDQKGLRVVSRRFVQTAPSSVRSLDRAQSATNRLLEGDSDLGDLSDPDDDPTDA
jgi:hypothetical protein